MNTTKKSLIIFFGALFVTAGLFFPTKTTKAWSIGGFNFGSNHVLDHCD